MKSIYRFVQGLLTGTTLIWQIDTLDDPVRSTDVNKCKDRHLMDVSESAVTTLNVLLSQDQPNGGLKRLFSQPSTLIIVAISPQYKADIEGSVVDSRGVHTRYIYAMVSGGRRDFQKERSYK